LGAGNFPAFKTTLFSFNSHGNEFVQHIPLQFVRPETFELMNESLPAPHTSFVIAAMARTPDERRGGAAQLVYTDGQKAMCRSSPSQSI
jgi:hypothetical protein